MNLVRLISLAVLLNTWSAAAHADRWSTAETRLSNSPSGTYSLVISPPDMVEVDSNADLMLVTKEKDGGLKIIQFRAVNRISPVEAFVSDNGFVLTLDNWLSRGYEHSVVVYGQDGKLIQDYGLEEILDASDIENVPTSVSSRHWRFRSEPIEMKGNTVRMTTALGGSLYVYLATGHVEVRKSPRFPRLIRHLQSSSPQLLKIEYESWGPKGHVRCNWGNDISTCEKLGKDREPTTISKANVPDDSFMRSLLQLFTHAKSVEQPSYCGMKCEGQQVIRLFFWEYPSDGWTWVSSIDAKKVSYQVTFKMTPNAVTPSTKRLAEFLDATSFVDQ